jgi:DNA-binding MarR family transcriptional regulator/N-acetylglutamate synthase-like GNAT family acetyltransferase
MEEAIAAVRSFNRFYTRRVGALNARFLGTELSLPEARLLFEIIHAEASPLASDLQRLLGMDAGFVSRVLARFEARGWIVRESGAADARRRPIRIAPAGREVFYVLDKRQRGEVEAMVRNLAPAQQTDLIAALGAARTMLDPERGGRDFAIRTFRAGDLGLLAARQSILYREEYGWGRGLEHNVSETVTNFLAGYREGRDQCWIAEVAGAMAGSIILTDEGEGLSRLRLFYVEPMARGRGIGDALVRTCLDFAREAGFTAMTLWTHTVLTSARRIYAAHGFEIVETAVHEEFGKPEQGEIWRLEL